MSKGSITTEETEKLSAVFGALADPTRRGIIERVRVESKTVAELASDFAISLPAVSKHLKVLDKAGMVHRAKSGKYILCSYNPEPGQAAMKWIERADCRPPNRSSSHGAPAFSPGDMVSPVAIISGSRMKITPT